MDLTESDIIHIAKLARLDLTDEELALYGKQLPVILDFVNQLQAVDTKSVEPTAQVTGITNIFREDVIREWDAAEVEEALNQAPAKEGRQLKVKRILE